MVRFQFGIPSTQGFSWPLERTPGRLQSHHSIRKPVCYITSSNGLSGQFHSLILVGSLNQPTSVKQPTNISSASNRNQISNQPRISNLLRSVCSSEANQWRRFSVRSCLPPWPSCPSSPCPRELDLPELHPMFLCEQVETPGTFTPHVSTFWAPGVQKSFARLLQAATLVVASLRCLRDRSSLSSQLAPDRFRDGNQPTPTQALSSFRSWALTLLTAGWAPVLLPG